MKKKYFCPLLFFLVLTGISAKDYYYYNGNQKIPLVMEDKLYIKFNTPTAKPVLKKTYNDTLIYKQGTVEIHKQAVNTSINGGEFPQSSSPVFRDASGHFYGLPGNVLIFFPEGTGEKEALKLLKEKQYTVIRKLPLRSRLVFVLESPPGIPSLELADKLQEERNPFQALPNWWISRNIR
ncbi:MAG: hypothetical protein H7A25_25990 [Leptospiraceae bacterium]|nr:hypothetical protein [Leptospiraceae bacterium]MCP5503377.1 hypothetical protein [Leptospiraceae bacterium]